jgi:hypothetical protein
VERPQCSEEPSRTPGSHARRDIGAEPLTPSTEGAPRRKPYEPARAISSPQLRNAEPMTRGHQHLGMTRPKASEERSVAGRRCHRRGE